MTAVDAFRVDARIYRVLADPIRLAILDALAAGPLCVMDLKAEIGGIPDSKISYHLRLLQEAGLIAGACRQNFIDYTLTETGGSVRIAIRTVTAAFAGVPVERENPRDYSELFARNYSKIFAQNCNARNGLADMLDGTAILSDSEWRREINALLARLGGRPVTVEGWSGTRQFFEQHFVTSKGSLCGWIKGDAICGPYLEKRDDHPVCCICEMLLRAREERVSGGIHEGHFVVVSERTERAWDSPEVFRLTFVRVMHGRYGPDGFTPDDSLDFEPVTRFGEGQYGKMIRHVHALAEKYDAWVLLPQMLYTLKREAWFTHPVRLAYTTFEDPFEIEGDIA